jgi:hypothetical protein
MGKTGLAVVVSSIALGSTYLYALPSAGNGYGYKGYRGYDRPSSAWYWGDGEVYSGPSARNGSRGGPGHYGGGLSGGK